MTKQAPLSDWVHAVTDIPEGGLERERSVDAAALAALAEALQMERLDGAKASYRIQRLAGGGYRLFGRVAAQGVQLCIVSLEPIAADVAEGFDVEFWPDLPEPSGGEDLSILDERDVEPLENGEIPVGRIIFETISSGLDPYPRKDGAVFDWQETEAPAQSNVSPFAALSKLKDKSQE